jgi:predicted helicase
VRDGDLPLTGDAAGKIQLDSETLEWILDQHKEKSPKDPTDREKFNTYRFADHKEKVIDLLRRVTRVSVMTMKIVDARSAEKR